MPRIRPASSKSRPFAGECVQCGRYSQYLRNNGLCAKCARKDDARSTMHPHTGEYMKRHASDAHLDELARRAALELPLNEDPPAGRYGKQ